MMVSNFRGTAQTTQEDSCECEKGSLEKQGLGLFWGGQSETAGVAIALDRKTTEGIMVSDSGKKKVFGS